LGHLTWQSDISKLSTSCIGSARGVDERSGMPYDLRSVNVHGREMNNDMNTKSA
jgi:hypothetical protein